MFLIKILDSILIINILVLKFTLIRKNTRISSQLLKNDTQRAISDRPSPLAS